MTATDLKKRAISLAEKTKIDSVTPEEVGQLSNDIVEYIENVEINGSSLGIRKTYTSVSAMEADSTAPKDDKGVLLRRGMLVNIYNQEDPDSADNGKVFSFQNPGWAFRGTVDAGYATKEELTELDEKVNIIEGIAITGEKEYSHINVDINSDDGTVWYNNRAYPEVSNVSGIKINARNAGTIELGIFNKNEKTMNIVDSVDVKKGIGEYFFNQTHTVDISNECFYIQNASGYYILSHVSSDEYFPYISSGLIQNNVGKGDILIQLITIPNLKNEIEQIRHELDYVKNETEKIQVIEDDITDISYATNSGITESGKCGNFDISSKKILEGTNRFYKKISLLKSKTLGIDASNSSSYKVVVFYQEDKFVFFLELASENEVNIEPIVNILNADRAVIITNNELSDEMISLSGNIMNPSVSEIESGNLWTENNAIIKGSKKDNIFGIHSVPSYSSIFLVPVRRNSTYYHTAYMRWSLYDKEGNFVSKSYGDKSVDIETGEADYALVDRPTTVPVIISLDSELAKSDVDVPYYLSTMISSSLYNTPYKSLSMQSLIELLKGYITDKYTGKSVFFVGNSYAAGVNALEFKGYPNDFAYRHPLANTQYGASYVWSGRTISTLTGSCILSSVLKICSENGYIKTPLNYPLTEKTDLQYAKSILFEDITEIDRIIGRKKAGTVIVYSVNKVTFEKTKLKRISMQADVTEYTFREKIVAKEDECIGIEFSATFAYKSDGNTFKAMDGSVINGSPLVQVCCNRCDYLIMSGGLNDMYQRGEDFETQVPFGTLLDADDYTTDDFDDRTFCGALEHMVREAVFKLPATKLGFLIMPQPGDETWNNQYAKAIREVCNKYGVPYLDMGNLKRMKIVSLDSEASREFWCTNVDGTLNYHPSAIGYNVMMNDAINTFIDSL
nr:MAG TPA_asm: GDSL like Lipase Acylhydrolase [Caudoviricetes sp.]